ncbi:MAG: Na(+)-translocating NADH-quinone reductase subunit C [bacterium]|nr:Na(+)-translocating NADH-quinone reductase subunit C [bacterium]
MSSNDTLKNIVGVALAVCFVCAIFVSSATVLLKSKQEANKRLDKRKNVLLAADLLGEDGSGDVEKIFTEKVEPVLINLKTGEQLPKDQMTGKLDPVKYDLKKLSMDSETSDAMPADKDIAKIKRKGHYSLLYFVKEDNKLSKIVLPVYGQGLWSTLYGFLALDRDLKTVKGFTFYEHGETPGLGGEVDNKRWKAKWKEKIAFSESGEYQLKVLKGKASPGSDKEIDGLSGATITTRGVNDLVKFWLGADGFGPFLDKLKQEGV